MASVKNDEGKFSVHSGRDRISARIIDSSSGEAILVNGITSSNGIPFGFEEPRKTERKRQKFGINKLKSFVFSYYLTIGWLFVCAMLGAYFQGWL